MAVAPVMTATDIVRQLTGVQRRNNGYMACCPVHSDSTPSLSVRDTADGVRVHCFAGCDWRAVRIALGLEDKFNSARPVAKLKAECPPTQDWSAQAEHIWQSSIQLAGSPAQAYLEGRGCFVPECADLRFLPAKNGQEHYPAMVARITDAVTGLPISLHCTFLLADGTGKAPIDIPKKLLKGHRKAGGVIRLCDDAEVTLHLGIAEGIETALTCAAYGCQPVWAAIDAGNMAKFPILPGIESLTVFADHDPAGLKAANTLRDRWIQAGREVRIVAPAMSGSDWADMTGAANA